MKRLLIVEDEKMIRQGIAVMARRCQVEIEEILECRNGEEAMEILQRCHVDVMFTDIRMPKMDGIELVRRVSGMERPPLIVVVSGFDDFNYAVEMLKNGVRDYILKPIKREKVEETLRKFDKEIAEVQEKEAEDVQGVKNQLRYLIQNEAEAADDWNVLEHRIMTCLKTDAGSYRIMVCPQTSEAELSYEILRGYLGIICDQMVIIFFSKELDVDKIREISGMNYAGISAVHGSIRELKDAYGEAVKCRREAFFNGRAVMWDAHQSEMPESSCEAPNEEFEEQFLQQFGTERMDQALRQFQNLFFLAEHNRYDRDALIETAEHIRKSLEQNYSRVIHEGMEGASGCRSPLSYAAAGEFTEAFYAWSRQLKACLTERFDSDQNHGKIREALTYIQENYQKDLNMAMVSNYVSMNYSLFSITFKEYTGVNFVNYLKDIRIREAKRLLENTDEKILDISRRCGYENEKHFMKTFKLLCGVSPSEYRKNIEMIKRTGKK